MNLLDSIKKLLNFNKKSETKIPESEAEAVKSNSKEENDFKRKGIELMAEKALEAKVEGKYEKALKLWDEFAREYPEAEPQARARKAKIHIILDDRKSAEKELLSFFKWYSEKGSFDYSSRYFTVFISALQDLGFYAGNWPDEEDYRKNIAGEDIHLDKKLTMNRVEKGLELLKEKDIWSSSLEEVEKNLNLL